MTLRWSRRFAPGIPARRRRFTIDTPHTFG
jgi:hypothetical protein